MYSISLQHNTLAVWVTLRTKAYYINSINSNIKTYELYAGVFGQKTDTGNESSDCYGNGILGRAEICPPRSGRQKLHVRPLHLILLLENYIHSHQLILDTPRNCTLSIFSLVPACSIISLVPRLSSCTKLLCIIFMQISAYRDIRLLHAQLY